MQSVVQTDEGDLNDDNRNSFLQFAGDNVDHSLATLDGKGTFHGMGIILTIIIGPDRGDLTLSIITLLTVRSPI